MNERFDPSLFLLFKADLLSMAVPLNTELR
jgi:hypothetical protein